MSHLVTKDNIWDPGSMKEQVNTIFSRLQKAKASGTTGSIKKYLTERAAARLETEIIQLNELEKLRRMEIEEVAILGVRPGNKSRPDGFRALLSGNIEQPEYESSILFQQNERHEKERSFEEQWSLIHQGGWWILDGWEGLRLFL